MAKHEAPLKSSFGHRPTEADFANPHLREYLDSVYGIGPPAEIEGQFKELGLKYQTEEQLVNNLLENEHWTAGERTMIGAAYELASRLHVEDTHKDTTYIFHLLRVANRIQGYLHQNDAELIAAALLHDSVEDHADRLAINSVDKSGGQDGQEPQDPILLQPGAF